MKLKNVLIVVKDIKRSRDFYHDVFGLDLLLDIGKSGAVLNFGEVGDPTDKRLFHVLSRLFLAHKIRKKLKILCIQNFVFM